ncbi:MAG: sulfate adenylyltransferase [Lachnospiraceae bacterium]|jgi:sulfate adenylyltransferase|nr:sulfate adenylyltransferase [Lachnospiraceae bacterium]
MNNYRVNLDEETLQDLINIETGLFAPLGGFMDSADFRSVIDRMCLADRSPWTIPVTMDISKDIYRQAQKGDTLELVFGDRPVGTMVLSDCYAVTDEDICQTFKTLEDSHPGVAKERKRSPYRAGGPTRVTDPAILTDALKPAETKADFARNGWRRVTGFQTRNPIHNAHEYLQRTALALSDAIFINPITGWKKSGDFTEEAVNAAYEKMMADFYPPGRVYYRGLKTQMRYAGPREAVFHALIRRNLGCTHFIVGRDHAGVGGFYGPYEAHELVRGMAGRFDLGIEILLFNEPYHCTQCGYVVTNKTCRHEDSHRVEISGTIIRDCLHKREIPDAILMRPEISAEIIKLERMFI